MKKWIVSAMIFGGISFSSAQSSYYNDYRQSISEIDWVSLISNLALNNNQANEIYSLNNRYNNYDSWDRTYRNSPDRWRNDRYMELERIMGREKYAQFKNRYYRGQNPVAVYNRDMKKDKRYKHMYGKAKHYKGKGHSKKHGNGHR